MGSNFLKAHISSIEYNRRTLGILLSLTGMAFLLSVLVSTNLVIALFIGLMTIYLGFMKPSWLLAGLLFYLPFESFILKWISDDIYIYARFYSEIIIYLLALVIFWQLAIGYRKWVSTKADLPFFLFILVIFISGLLNFIDPVIFALGARQIIRFMLLYFIVVQLQPSKEFIINIMKVLGVILVFQICLGFAQYLFGDILDLWLLPSERRTFGELEITGGTDYFWDPGERIFATFGRYDRFGVYLAFNMLFLTAILYEPKIKAKIREWALPTLLAGIPVLALTYSRSAWFGFVLGFLFIAFYLYKDKRVLWIGGGIIGFLLFYLMFSGLVVSNLIDVPGQGLVERFFEAFSFERWRGEYFGLGRVYWIVQTLLVVLPASPFFGHGPASFGGGAVFSVQNTVVYDKLGLPFGIYGTQGMIDNNWFSLLGELGLIGFGLFLWMYIVFFKDGLKIFRNTKSTFTKIFAGGMTAMLLAVALNAFLATFFEIRTLGPYLWAGLGFMMVLAQKEEIKLEYENNSSK